LLSLIGLQASRTTRRDGERFKKGGKKTERAADGRRAELPQLNQEKSEPEPRDALSRPSKSREPQKKSRLKSDRLRRLFSFGGSSQRRSSLDALKRLKLIQLKSSALADTGKRKFQRSIVLKATFCLKHADG